MFRFQLDGSSGVPPYLQLVHQVRQSLLLGYLREGDRLPTVAELSSGHQFHVQTTTTTNQPPHSPTRSSAQDHSAEATTNPHQHHHSPD